MKKVYINPRIVLRIYSNEDVLTDSPIVTNGFKSDVYNDGWTDLELF